MAWEQIIRPGIKQNLIGALLASQDNMVNRKNSFQLYGADFVVADNFSVWLLEINTNPRLHPPSSTVTAKLYPEVIEDAMKGMLLCYIKTEYYKKTTHYYLLQYYYFSDLRPA